VRLYEDDKTWEQHYQDWERILSTLTFNPKHEIKREQYDYKVKVLKKLIKEYEVNKT